MKQTIFTFLLFLPLLCFSDHKLTIYYEEIEGGYEIYADNLEYSPLSVKVDFTTTNLNVEGGNNNIYVVPASTKKQLLTTLQVANNKKSYQFSYQYFTNYGDHHDDDYDEDFAYHLPFETNQKYEIYQGYNGNFSHQNENSIDFTMPEGTKVLAARAGTVVKVVDEFNKNCGSQKCEKYNNYILIYHNDGSFAQYIHLQKNGAEVKAGNKVKQDELIGYSGNTGWSNGPHLHLSIFMQKLNNRNTLETNFLTGNGDTLELLKENEVYSRNY